MSPDSDSPTPGDVTRLLHDVGAGDRAAFDRLMPVVYVELRRIAQAQMRRERSDLTLQTTGLVHEAYLKLVDRAQVDWHGRAHFYSIAARAMRQILVDHARRRGAEKRGGDRQRTSLTGKPLGLDDDPHELLALDRALDALAQQDESLRQVVEMRFFGGMSEKEIADVRGVSVRTVQRDWVRARAWLYKELYPSEPGEA